MQIREDLFNHVGKYENMVDLGRTYNCRGTKVGDPTMVKTKGAHMNKSFCRKRRCCKIITLWDTQSGNVQNL